MTTKNSIPITESIKKSFRLEFPPIDEPFDPQKCIAENSEGIYQSVEIDNKDQVAFENFFEQVNNSEKVESKFTEKEKGEFRDLDEVFHMGSGDYITPAHVHELCRKYKRREEVFPYEITSIRISKTLDDYYSEEEEDSVIPYWIALLKFENGQILISLYFGNVTFESMGA